MPFRRMYARAKWTILTIISKFILCVLGNTYKNIDYFRVDVYTKYILRQSSRKAVTQNY